MDIKAISKAAKVLAYAEKAKSKHSAKITKALVALAEAKAVLSKLVAEA